MPPLLTLENLQVHFPTPSGTVKAVDGVSLEVAAGETLALVGESGSGKSMTGLSVLGLVPPPGVVSGAVYFEGEDLLQKSPEALRRLRGNDLAMVFQEPMTSLNPVYPVGRQIAEALTLHEGLSRRAALERTGELLARVGLPDPNRRLRDYPHQLSGGMRQRVMLALALSCRPKLLIADEPTTALDVTIQAQILDLLRDLQAEFGMAVLFITHDLGVVAEIADRVAVLYAGRVVEEAPVHDLFAAPKMPYTLGLLQSIPRIDRTTTGATRLSAIPGNIPPPLHRPTGCTFHPRCTFAVDACRTNAPPLEALGPHRRVRCLRHADLNLQPEAVP